MSDEFNQYFTISSLVIEKLSTLWWDRHLACHHRLETCATYSSPSSSSFSAIGAMPVTLSSFSISISLTPCVFLPITDTPFIAILIIFPILVVIMSSSSPVTWAIPTTGPFFSVTLMLIMPIPPRSWLLYSLISVLLPYPLSVTVRIVLPSSRASAATTTSSL